MNWHIHLFIADVKLLDEEIRQQCFGFAVSKQFVLDVTLILKCFELYRDVVKKTGS